MKYQGFYDYDQFSSYMRNSIITVDSDPVYVTETTYDDDEDLMMFYFYILHDSNKSMRGPLSIGHSSVDLSPVKLGLLTYGSPRNENLFRTVKTQRQPQRSWKIGLTKETMQVSNVGGEKFRPPRARDLIRDPALGKTILGQYLNYQATLRRMCQDDCLIGNHIAFSRNFSLRKSENAIEVLNSRRAIPIGFVDDNGDIQLSHDAEFLTEALEGAML